MTGLSSRNNSNSHKHSAEGTATDLTTIMEDRHWLAAPHNVLFRCSFEQPATDDNEKTMKRTMLFMAEDFVAATRYAAIFGKRATPALIVRNMSPYKCRGVFLPCDESGMVTRNSGNDDNDNVFEVKTSHRELNPRTHKARKVLNRVVITASSNDIASRFVAQHLLHLNPYAMDHEIVGIQVLRDEVVIVPPCYKGEFLGSGEDSELMALESETEAEAESESESSPLPHPLPSRLPVLCEVDEEEEGESSPPPTIGGQGRTINVVAVTARKRHSSQRRLFAPSLGPLEEVVVDSDDDDDDDE